MPDSDSKLTLMCCLPKHIKHSFIQYLFLWWWLFEPGIVYFKFHLGIFALSPQMLEARVNKELQSYGAGKCLKVELRLDSIH